MLVWPSTTLNVLRESLVLLRYRLESECDRHTHQHGPHRRIVVDRTAVVMSDTCARTSSRSLHPWNRHGGQCRRDASIWKGTCSRRRPIGIDVYRKVRSCTHRSGESSWCDGGLHLHVQDDGAKSCASVWYLPGCNSIALVEKHRRIHLPWHVACALTTCQVLRYRCSSKHHQMVRQGLVDNRMWSSSRAKIGKSNSGWNTS